MVLEDGIYTIRHLVKGESPGAPGGMYASSKDGKDKPLTAEPLGPDSKIRWWIACVPGKDSEYTITEAREDEGIPGRWAREPNAPDTPVWLIDRLTVGNHAFEWGIREDDKPGVYNISSTRGDFRDGATEWVDLGYPELGPEIHLRSVCLKTSDAYVPCWVIRKA